MKSLILCLMCVFMAVGCVEPDRPTESSVEAGLIRCQRTDDGGTLECCTSNCCSYSDGSYWCVIPGGLTSDAAEPAQLCDVLDGERGAEMSGELGKLAASSLIEIQAPSRCYSGGGTAMCCWPCQYGGGGECCIYCDGAGCVTTCYCGD